MSAINVVIAGVGGQGNVIGCQIIGMAAVEEGWQVSTADTFGVSQRGGAVMSHLRMARGNSYGPLISAGEADVVLGLEPLETVRVLRKYGNPRTRVILNTRPNYPLAVLGGVVEYPSIPTLLDSISQHSQALVEVPADRLARETGSMLTQNVVMAGALAGSGWLPLRLSTFDKVLRALFEWSPRILECNLLAFQLGMDAGLAGCRRAAACSREDGYLLTAVSGSR